MTYGKGVLPDGIVKLLNARTVNARTLRWRMRRRAAPWVRERPFAGIDPQRCRPQFPAGSSRRS
ncbi:hypothetical protein GCM10009864_60820 [Streptomyces lunalinharesii]|uniref:Transposase n=1 Tax=Streptomyces lunalinharesii TaxID=333384 RepID=A0ABN3SLZ9_9ACTN